LAGAQVGCHDAKRNPHLFEAVAPEQSLQERLHALARHESHPAEAPPPDVAEPHGTGDACDVVGRRAAGIRRRDNRARAHPGDAVEGNAVALEGLEDADVRHAPREAPAERQSEAGRID
jgi:hypothetical protein